MSKRRSVYLANTATEQYSHETGCRVAKISRNEDCLESSDRLLQQVETLYHETGLPGFRSGSGEQKNNEHSKSLYLCL